LSRSSANWGYFPFGYYQEAAVKNYELLNKDVSLFTHWPGINPILMTFEDLEKGT
jgi:hypothetical protein